MRGPTFFLFDPTQRNTCALLMGGGFRRSLSRTSGKRMTMVQATDSDTTTPTTCARSLVRRPNRRRALTHGSRSRPARPARSDIARSASVTPNATLTGQTGNPEDREGQDRRRAQDGRARLGPDPVSGDIDQRRRPGRPPVFHPGRRRAPRSGRSPVAARGDTLTWLALTTVFPASTGCAR
jgi:hypothetical protein